MKGHFGMTQHTRYIVCLLGLMFVGRRAAAQTPPAEDFQEWTNVGIAWQIKPKLTISAFGEVHLGSDVSQFDQELVSAGIIYSPSRWVSVSTGYLYLHANPKLSGISSENRMYVEVTFHAPSFHEFLLSDRVRPELRWERAPATSTFTQRYRNRVILERPIKQYSPFVMWERFYSEDAKAWNKTRYYIGFMRPLNGKASMQLYFLRQNDEFFRPFRKNAIGATIMFHFGNERRSPRTNEVQQGHGE